MAGFTSFRQLGESLTTEGKYHFASFRKVISNATASGTWADLSYSPGNPVPNFYATEPLVSAVLDGDKGIYCGENVSPDKKYLHRLSAYSPSVAFNNSTLMLCDYLLYYPFVDCDSTDVQDLANSVPLPRETSGLGVQAMLVAQGAYTGNVQVSIAYTNSDSVPGRVSPLFTTNTAAFAGTLLSGGTAVGGSGPFLPMQSGDKGIRSVERITFSAANGGIASLVLVKPIAEISLADITATLPSPAERENAVDVLGFNQIEDGAYLNFICLPSASLSAAQVQGLATFVWG